MIKRTKLGFNKTNQSDMANSVPWMRSDCHVLRMALDIKGEGQRQVAKSD